MIAKIGFDTAENEPFKVCWYLQPTTPSRVINTAQRTARSGGRSSAALGRALRSSTRKLQPQAKSPGHGLRARPSSRSDGWTLVERFHIEPFSDFSAKWANFMSLVLWLAGWLVGRTIFKNWRYRRGTKRWLTRLYRSQIVQLNTRWKALAEIYTMHFFAPFWNPYAKTGEKGAWPFSKLKNFVKNRRTFC